MPSLLLLSKDEDILNKDEDIALLIFILHNHFYNWSVIPFMLFSSKTGGLGSGLNSARNKTPTKSQTMSPLASKQPKKETGKYESTQK